MGWLYSWIWFATAIYLLVHLAAYGKDYVLGAFLLDGPDKIACIRDIIIYTLGTIFVIYYLITGGGSL